MDTNNAGSSRHPSQVGESAELADYCREIETYLCRKNDGHLIRVVGPSFELVSRWAREGIPLKVACAGIDRYFERYYRKGPRRRPVRIDFCEADVLDVFDDWRRATGVTGLASGGGDGTQSARRAPSLPEHLERALIKLTDAQATGRLGAALDPLIDQLSQELDRARGAAGGIRGDARRAMGERLTTLDASMLSVARLSLPAEDLEELRRESVALLGPLADRMAEEARDRARERALDQLVRERYHLPTITFS